MDTLFNKVAGSDVRYLLGRLLSHLGYLERQIRELGQRIGQRLQEMLPAEACDRMDAIPGFNQTMIENVLAETGVDMTIFPEEHHLASWWGCVWATKNRRDERCGAECAKSIAGCAEPWWKRPGWPGTGKSLISNGTVRSPFFHIQYNLPLAKNAKQPLSGGQVPKTMSWRPYEPSIVNHFDRSFRSWFWRESPDSG